MEGQSGISTKPLGVLTSRPALPVAVLLSIGILLHTTIPHRPAGLLIAIASFAIIAALTRYRFVRTSCLAVIVVLLGTGVAQREHFEFSKNDIGYFVTDQPHLTEIEFRLIDDPQISIGPADQRPLPPKQIATGEMLRIKTWNGWVEVTGRLPVQIDQIAPEIRGGQTFRALGMLQRPRAAMNPGEFDWAEFYRQQRILADFTVNRAGNIHILAPPDFSALRWLRAKTRHLLAMGFTAADSTDHALLDAMLLGDRDPPLRDIQPQFLQIGIGYQLSVCGLHIAFFAWIIFLCCRAASLRPRFTLGIVTGFVLFYAGVSLPSHSGIRSAILCVIAAIALLSSRSMDRLQLLSLGAIAMLLWHPMDLYSAGFHLSFAVVIAFVFLVPAMKRWQESWRSPDEIALQAFGSKPPWRRARDAILDHISTWTRYALIAWLATLPLVVFNFGHASSWSILGSLLTLPLVLLSLIGGALKIVVTLLWPIAAGKWAFFCGMPVRWLLAFVHLLNRLPGNSVTLPAPPIWLIVVYYLLLFAPLLPYRWGLVGRRRWILRIAPLLGVASIFLLQFSNISRPVATTDLRVTLLSLGAGQCAVVEVPGGHPILIDAGSTTVSDVARKIVEPFLQAEGDRQVDDIFLSHGDFDHISAADEITADYSVRQVFTSYHFRRNAVGNVPDQILLEELEKLNRPPKEIALGGHFDLGSGAAIDVLWPPKVGDLNSNNAGLVLRLTYAGRSILFPADIQDPGFTGVLKNAKALKSDVLIAAHHGSSEDLTPAFLAAVNPKIILSSNFWRLTSKQKRFETMIGRTPLYRTPECGSITVTIHMDGTMSVETFVKGAKPK